MRILATSNPGTAGARMVSGRQTGGVSASKRSKKLLLSALVGMSGIYLLQALTPLRLITDSIVYLSIATSALDGHGFLFHGATERYPLGYPALIFVLAKLGLGRPWAFVGLNCLFLGLGLYAGYKVLRRSFLFSDIQALCAFCLTMLSFVVVKHVTQVLTDIVYFGVSMCCMWFIIWAADSLNPIRRISRLLIAACFVVLAISVRAIGIALIPATLLVACYGSRSLTSGLERFRSKKILLAFSLFLLLATAIVTRTTYFRMALESYRSHRVFRNFATIATDQAHEWGEIALNVPAAKLPHALQPAVPLAGILAIAIVLSGIWIKRQSFGAVEAYVLCYLAIVCVAPWQDARYLLPVVPLLIGYTAVFLRHFANRRPMKLAAVAYVVWFCLLGTAALVYSTRITLAGGAFPDLYGDGQLRATYKAAFDPSAQVKPDQINSDVFSLLRRYDPRALPRNAGR